MISDLITGESKGFSAPVRFLYDDADPYAVSLDFTDLNTAAGHEDEAPCVWTFARQILIPGNVADEDTAHRQDVRVHRDGAWLIVGLRSQDGAEDFRFPAQAVARFVHRTMVAVPLGRESRHMAATLDAAVARLLGGVR